MWGYQNCSAQLLAETPTHCCETTAYTQIHLHVAGWIVFRFSPTSYYSVLYEEYSRVFFVQSESENVNPTSQEELHPVHPTYIVFIRDKTLQYASWP